MNGIKEAFVEGFADAMHVAKLVLLIPVVAAILVFYAIQASIAHRPLSLRAAIAAAKPQSHSAR